jgi:hypothetical protein
MRKAPANRGLLVEVSVVLSGRRGYFFFFGAAFFFAGAFLVAFFIDLILPNVKFAIQKSQCDSYIKSFRKIVKEKICGSGPFLPQLHRSAEMF